MRGTVFGRLGVCLVCAVTSCAGAPEVDTSARGTATHIQKIRRQPYDMYRTHDDLGREITFYLSEEPADGATLPLVLYVQGSGCRSHFVSDEGVIRGATGHSSIADACRGKARLVIVEKPGVEYLDNPTDPGGAMYARPAFREEHTLGRWVEACIAALESARSAAPVDPSRLLVIGHSEGGIVAAAIAARLDSVTHLALLSSGGPTQLYDIEALARQGVFFEEVSAEPAGRAMHVRDSWRQIAADPESADRMFFGHPYRRWSSFLTHSTVEYALSTDAMVYAAQGELDQGHTRESFEMLCAELRAHGRDVVQELVSGADHSFAVRGEGARDEWGPLVGRVVEWFVTN